MNEYGGYVRLIVDNKKIGSACPAAPPGSAQPFDFLAWLETAPFFCHTTNWIHGTWNVSVRQYANGRCVLRVFPERHGVPRRPLPDEETVPSTLEEKQRVAVSRARSLIFDLAFGNTWDYFITLTFDRKIVGDRYDYDNVKLHMKTFTQFLWRHGCQWLLVPEYHEDKAYHFHGLVSGHLDSVYRETKIRNDVFYDCYSIAGYHKGRSDISPIKDQSRVSSYITKYITKDYVSCVPPGAKKYWASRSLARPIKMRAFLGPNEISSLIQSSTYKHAALDPVDNEIVTLIM